MPGNKRRSMIMAAVAVTVVLVGALILWFIGRESPGSKNNLQLEQDIPPELSAWLVDWQWEAGLADVERLGGEGLAGLQLFAAYFDEADRLYFNNTMTEALPNLREMLGDGTAEVGLTIVNDRINRDGTSVPKDPELVSRLIATEESRGEHIRQIVETASAYDLKRIEIDYEKIKEVDWERLCLFYKELFKELKEAGISLRIVLEPRTPLKSIKLPEGPEYVMMAYNLYGTHSGPGPKADLSMIRKLADKMTLLPGDPVMAFSVGGFDWAESGDVTALTEIAAVRLAEKHGAVLQRDSKSGSLFFKYTDEEGEPHTVWYADQETIAGWIETAKKQGIYNISLWRLGELGDATLEYLREYHGN